MILEIKEERKIERCSKYFVQWTKSEFEELVRLTKKARVKKDGTPLNNKLSIEDIEYVWKKQKGFN